MISIIAFCACSLGKYLISKLLPPLNTSLSAIKMLNNYDRNKCTTNDHHQFGTIRNNQEEPFHQYTSISNQSLHSTPMQNIILSLYD